MTQTSETAFASIDQLAYAGMYGDQTAPVYDLMYPAGPNDEECADFVAGLLPAGASVLELGVGTGRLAVPLVDKGFRVHGVDASQGMLAKLAERDPEGRVGSTHATFTDYRLDERFDLVLGSFNALCLLQSSDDQVAALRNARTHLAPGGKVVLETFEPAKFHSQQQTEMNTYPLGPNSVVIESMKTVRALQLIFLTTSIFDESSKPEVAVTFLRYIWPGELDQMAARAGLRLVERFAGWKRQAIDDGAAVYVSVFEADDQA
ncbi:MULTISPECIES: bifunctional 2-polyprenyl-6-hydroxyphenol methylase/3-demethylubiquinol 3-O-methyltransferase UbiG [unclassified Crossiella]|uniref:class I SAM-dependent methyltransferase n=1 Tax=unclassified Crossiella TaxID=2620835 RepID=UPI001FFFCB3C|nr:MULTISPECIES: class I SAM-dependent methyltransferase [unclassified Crossiella]MCK2241646.1 class I SAM-dependent methyltransferase [Crossiella sp. S99.2]MCK2255482.1 class I SAM-dependent methyltransferase [Crossiella sp. S99.1]